MPDLVSPSSSMSRAAMLSARGDQRRSRARQPVRLTAALLLLAGGSVVAAEDPFAAAMETRAQEIFAATRDAQKAKPNAQSVGYPWLAEWYLRRGETAEGLRVLYQLLDTIRTDNQGHPFLSYGLAHLWLHYGKLYDEAHAAKWLELTRARGTYSYNLDPYPANYSTTNLRMTGSTAWYLSTLGFGLDKLPASYPPKDDPTRNAFLHRALTKIGRTGMPEFASRPYGGMDSLPLLCLAEQTADPELARKAAVVYETYLATAAATWLQGHWPVATQRSYTDTITQRATSGINLLWMYFGGLPGDANPNGMAAAAMAYRPPVELAWIANRRDRAYTTTMRGSWIKDDDPDIRLDPTGFLQYTWSDRTYAVYSQMTTPGTRLQELQVYGNGVMWQDPSGATSGLWVTVPTAGTGHTHGQPEEGVEYVQHEGSLLLVAKPVPGEAFPWIKGNVPANHQALIDDTAADGRLYLAYPSVLIAITAPRPFTWDPELVIQIDHIKTDKRRKPTDKPTDGFYRLKEGPLAVAIDTMAEDRAQGATPAERLAWFRGQVRERTRLTAGDGTASYRALNGHELQRTVGALPRVDGTPIAIEAQPFMTNPWLSQPYQQDPQQPCELTVSIDGRTRIYDLKDYTIRTHAGPARPTHLVVMPAAGAVELRWTPGPGEPTGYVIRRAEGEGSFADIGTATAPTWRDPGVRDGISYRYEVAARNAGGTSPGSIAVPVIPGAGIPTNPAGLGAVAGDAQVTLRWQASPGATGYQVWRGTVPGGPYQSLAKTLEPTFTDAKVANFTSFWYVVSAVGAGGESGHSNETMALPTQLPPATPTGVAWEPAERTVDGVVQAGVQVRWQPVPGALRYNVRVAGSQRGLPINRAIARTETTAFLPNRVLVGSSWITVTATNGGGQSPGSDPLPLPTVEPPPKPVKPAAPGKSGAPTAPKNP